MQDLSKEITVYVISTGEPSTAECQRRLGNQDCLFQRDTIANVSPMFLAFQTMLDRCQTRYYVQVDSDMLLEPTAIRTLYEGIKGQGDKCAQYVCWLWDDDVERPIQGVKIYDHQVCSKYPYDNSISCEMTQNQRLSQDGYSIVAAPLTGMEHDGATWQRTACCLGTHFASQTPAMAFARWQRLLQKHRQLPWMGWIGEYPQRLEKSWLADPTNEIKKARYLGCISGMAGEIPTGEMDSRTPNQDYRRISAYVGEHSHGPRELTLYVNDKCNHRCTWCKRQVEGITGKGDLTLGMLTSVLNKYASIKSCCIAGYGEPLMHPGIGQIINELRSRNIYVGLITNGSLLSQKIEQVRGCGYISVSLNATDAESHKAVTQVDTWSAVLDGIRASKQAGIRTGISYVLHRSNLDTLPALMALLPTLGIDFCHVHNLLPHNGVNDPWWQQNVLRVNDPETIKALKSAKALPGSQYVESWPELIDPGNPPNRCQSPWVSIGIDASGMATYCRRIDPPSKESGGSLAPNAWMCHLRTSTIAQCVGDRESHPVCNGCFGSWRF